jgi:PAS domain S-box-containing protein
MEPVLDNIHLLIEAAVGSRTPGGVADGAAGCRPTLLLIADGRGDVVDRIELAPGAADCAETLGKELPTRLAGRNSCCWERSGGRELIVAGRLPAPETDRILACSFPSGCVAPSDDDVHNFRLLATAADRVAHYYRQNNGRLSTRIAHLLAERDMLKASHAAALEDAIEERESRLREQEALHLQNQMILNSAGEGIVGLDQAGRAVFVNPAAARLLGYGVDELIGKPFHDMVHHSRSDGRPYPRSECPMAQLRPVTGIANEVFWKKSGTSFPIEYTCTPINEGELSVGVVLTFRDISERRMLEAQLRQAQKLESIGQLAAGIAHEINTPTQYIGDNIRFLEDAFHTVADLLVAVKRFGELRDPSTLLPAIAEIRAGIENADLGYLLDEIPRAVSQSLDGVERVAKIVRSMKEFSHPGNEEKQAIDLNRAIESTITVSRNEWKYVADVVTRFDSNLPRVTCLPGDINQVLLNLIVNAAHAIGDKLHGTPGEKGEIGIDTCRDGNWVEIRVRDSGTGIPTEIQSRIFDPFFTTKPVGRGTGQGLAIVHSVITERHGGTIRFETQPGQGTTFILRFPIQDKTPERTC